jgi:Ca2+-transporting ATPase
VLGDPTEAALIVAARKAGIEQETLNKEKPRVDELPFDSARKCMTTIHEANNSRIAYVKGAPDIIIDKCDRILLDGKVRKLSEQDKRLVLTKNLAMANKALRVLGFAYKEVGKAEKDIESRLVFIGLMGMIDPPRTEVMDSIRKCREAGIKVVMITGDHVATAKAIGKDLGLPIGKVMTGSEIDQITHLSDIVDDVSIYARVSPQHKMRIVSALRSKQYVVAMTGDGVNDAPALKIADIGIAMGMAGTDVAKEASDMILTDDNFSSIVNAVEEGRGIYENIRKFVKYLLSSNIGEVLTIFIAALIGFHYPGSFKIIMPLTAIHLLWINLLTDSFPALALGVEPTDPDVMKKPPRKITEKIISWNYAFDMMVIGIILAMGTLYIFKVSLPVSEVYAVTMAFSVLVIFQLFNVLNCKSDEKSVFSSGFFKNKWLIAAIALSFALQLLAVYAPFMYNAAGQAGLLPASMSGIDMSAKLHTTALDLRDWAVVFLLGSTILIFEEVRKFFSRKLSMMQKHGGT